ncbi:hypothetical protein [Paenibacillus sp. JCM 10914]|uniref:hypothetical protein n=1 Tax=Paenibacillus sp. JCM 10914 TaxID=1236974 RepID=UPI000A9C811E|nr:hypothetical protein [Paenibacillus sp. JCM 10914]
MYIVSEPKSLSDPQIQAHVKEETGSWPPGYLDFLRRVGQGTYRGWMNVQIPDPEVLKPFAEYGLWEFDADSPITEQQIGDCIAIGTTVDGDFLAVHPQTAQLIWLPRHEEYLRVISLLQAGEQDHEWPYAWCWMKYIVRCMEAVKRESFIMIRGRVRGIISFCNCPPDRTSFRCPSWPACVERPFCQINPMRTPILAVCSIRSLGAM